MSSSPNSNPSASLNAPDFEAIKRSVSISEVLSKYVAVPNRNKYRIPCPIHQGEGWNFAVDNERGLFHCFTCEAGGDVVTLFALLEDITNGEAARRLSHEFGVRTGSTTSFNRVFNEVKQYEIHYEFPDVGLPESKPLEFYRRYSREAIQHFDLRLVPEGVLIPYRHTKSGRVVGYSIRQINKLPKYKNSDDFKKSEYLYGLAENEQDIVAARSIYVVEGQFDCIRMWDSGFRNVVSTLGAGMSPYQANILAGWTPQLVIVYDGDEKGRSEAQKIVERFGALFNIQIVTLPDGRDPDTADLKTILSNNGETHEPNGSGMGRRIL